MKLAVLGGSFNPVHNGHLYLADSVLTAFNYDRIILVPAFQSPFKPEAAGADAADRMEMLAASIPGDPRFSIDDCEINREGISYTIDTLKDIIARYRPEGRPGLILGDDLVSDFHKWHKPDEIAEIADIIIARRLPPSESPASPGSAMPPSASPGSATPASTENFAYPHKVLGNEVLNISSSMLRDKIAHNEEWRYLLPSGARYIIENRRLYGFNPVYQNEKNGKAHDLNAIVFLENEARKILDTRRFFHSRNTAVLAWDLALRFGQDCRKAYIAGICHDLCKNMKDDELIRLAGRDGGKISILEKRKPGLLHGRAAAILIKRKYGIEDREILDAVRYHTTGVWDMGDLEKIIYIADKIEISRSGLEPELREMISNADLETLFKSVLDDTVAHLRARSLDLSFGTRKLLAAMEKKNKT